MLQRGARHTDCRTTHHARPLSLQFSAGPGAAWAGGWTSQFQKYKLVNQTLLKHAGKTGCALAKQTNNEASFVWVPPVWRCSGLLSLPGSNRNKLLSYLPASDRERGWSRSCLLGPGVAITQSAETGRGCLGGGNTRVFITPGHSESREEMMPKGLIRFTNWRTLGLKRLLLPLTYFSLQQQPQESNFSVTLYTTATTILNPNVPYKKTTAVFSTRGPTLLRL